MLEADINQDRLVGSRRVESGRFATVNKILRCRTMPLMLYAAQSLGYVLLN